MPYSYEPHLRLTPLAGDAVDFDLSTILNATTINLEWDPVFLQKENVNRVIRNTLIGWRGSVLMVFRVQSASASETTLVNLGKRLMVPGEKMEVSLDGTVYRFCQLAAWSRVKAEGKNVDAIYQIGVVLDELLDADVVDPETLTAPPAIASWT